MHPKGLPSQTEQDWNIELSPAPHSAKYYITKLLLLSTINQLIVCSQRIRVSVCICDDPMHHHHRHHHYHHNHKQITSRTKSVFQSSSINCSVYLLCNLDISCVSNIWTLAVPATFQPCILSAPNFWCECYRIISEGQRHFCWGLNNG